MTVFFFLYTTKKKTENKKALFFFSQKPDINRGNFKKSGFKVLYAVFVRLLQIFLSHLCNKDAFIKSNKQTKMFFKIMQNDLIFHNFFRFE